MNAKYCLTASGKPKLYNLYNMVIPSQKFNYYACNL